MPSANEHVGILKRLLPQGPAWPTSDETGYDDGFTRLLRSLAQEPARIDAAFELILNELIPDSTLTDLASWERVLGLPEDCTRELTRTDAERLAAIRGKLRGRGAVNRAYLETVMAGLRGAPVNLLDRSTPQFRVGTSAVGQPLRGDQWLATWLLEYMPSLLAGMADPDDFENGAWGGSAVALNAQFGSPVTLQSTAASVSFAAGGDQLYHELTGTEDNDVVRLSIWLRTQSAGDRTLLVTTIDRTGNLDATTPFNIGPSWARIERLLPLGAGASQPFFVLQAEDLGGASIYASYAVAGIVDTVYECQVAHQPPINTTGEYNVLGENGP